MATTERVSRVSQSIQQTLAQVIVREVKDPRLQFVTITGVAVSKDLAHAKVYIAIPGEETVMADALKALEKATGFLRHRLGETLRLRLTPTVTFFADPAVVTGSRIDALLRDLDT